MQNHKNKLRSYQFYQGLKIVTIVIYNTTHLRILTVDRVEWNIKSLNKFLNSDFDLVFRLGSGGKGKRFIENNFRCPKKAAGKLMEEVRKDGESKLRYRLQFFVF